MEKVIRFRNSWFIQAGIGMIVLFGMPFGLVIFVGLVLHKRLEVGPTFLWFVLGFGFGLLCTGLGFLGVLRRNASQKANSQ
jgi:hypothetical protein